MLPKVRTSLKKIQFSANLYPIITNNDVNSDKREIYLSQTCRNILIYLMIYTAGTATIIIFTS